MLKVIASRKYSHGYIDSGIADHKLLLCSCEMLKPPYFNQKSQIRCWKFLDPEKFISEVKLFPLSSATSFDVDSASDHNNFTLSGIFDKMISLKCVGVHKNSFDPWFDWEYRISTCLKRSLKKIYMVIKSENDFAAWLCQKKLCERLCDTSVEITET